MIWSFNKRKQDNEKPVEKKPIYKQIQENNDQTNYSPRSSQEQQQLNQNLFGSKTNLLQGQEQLNPRNLDEIRKEVEETQDIMKDNIRTIENRGENLENLNKRAESTKKIAEQFKRNAKKVNKKLKNKDLRLKIFVYIGFSCLASLCFYIFFVVKEQNTISKILECVGGSISTLCVLYLAVNDCRDVIDFDLCLEKISCCNKDSEKEQSSDQTQPLQV